MRVYIHTLTHTFQSQMEMNHKCLDLIVVNISITIMVLELKKTNQILEGFEIAGHEGLVLFILFKMYFRKGKKCF